MLDDPRFQKIVYFFFFGGLAAAIIMVGSVVLARYGEIEQAAKPKGSPVELEDKEGRLIVPEEDLPQSLEEKLKAPSVSLLPSRTETISAAPAPPSVKKAIFRSVNAFLGSWESFLPGSVDYSSRIAPFSRGKNALALSGREDVTTISGLCPERSCTKGSQSAGAAELQLSDYDGQRAYVVGYGVIRVKEYGAEELYNQAYGIILYKSGNRWLIERAAAETLDPVSEDL